jgi:hypothetical protein
MKDEGARFVQSAKHFPATVSLGKQQPSWGLSRWNDEGLRFVPPDDESFALRGDKRRLVYRGRQRSHRFTMLGDTAFEYDCILEKEPQSNIITLFMEGAERFDFFRQPDFIKNPLLAGSYAVYKKETFIGEGTGKLCHIHRPEILDSQGRRCWGDLFITGNRLCIVIPETWLANAVYPVIVDPIIGLSSLGVLGPENLWGADEEDEDEDEKGDGPSMIAGYDMRVNEFIAPHNITGNCTAYLYVDCYSGMYIWSLTNYKMWPVLYSHDLVYDRPGIIKSSDGGYISTDVGRKDGPPRGWRSADIVVDGTIQQGSKFWFGFFFMSAHPRYDYGGRLFESHAWPYQDSYAGLRQTFYHYPIEVETDTYIDARGNEIEYETWCQPSYELKISMYLEYTVPSTNYTRTLMQGTTLTDNRKLTGNYQRSAKQTAQGKAVANKFEGFYRSMVQTVKSAMNLKGPLALIRKLTQQAGAGDTGQRFLSLLRKPAQTAGVGSGTQRITQAKRAITDTGKPGTATGRKQDFKRGIAHGETIQTAALRHAGYAKRFQETAGSATYTGVARTVAIRLVVAVAVLYEMKAGAGFNRGTADTAGIGSMTGGMVTFFRALFGLAEGEDHTGGLVTQMRFIQDTETALDDTGHTADYLRGLWVEAGNRAETAHEGDYYRTVEDTAHNEALPLRHLFIFLRLLTEAYIRDYIIGWFLKSKEELIIKSPVYQEITLDSTLH